MEQAQFLQHRFQPWDGKLQYPLEAQLLLVRHQQTVCLVMEYALDTPTGQSTLFFVFSYPGDIASPFHFVTHTDIPSRSLTTNVPVNTVEVHQRWFALDLTETDPGEEPCNRSSLRPECVNRNQSLHRGACLMSGANRGEGGPQSVRLGSCLVEAQAMRYGTNASCSTCAPNPLP